MEGVSGTCDTRDGFSNVFQLFKNRIRIIIILKIHNKYNIWFYCN